MEKQMFEVGQYFVVNEYKADWQFVGRVIKIFNGQVEYEVVRGLHPAPADDERSFAVNSLWATDMVKFIDAKTAETLYGA